jgi:phage tail-like protein
MRRARIEHLLPEILRRTVQRGRPLYALLDVMEAMHAPSERALVRLDSTLDPRRAPDRFVPYLARWVDLEPIFDRVPREYGTTPTIPITTGLGRLRELIAAAAYLSQWRGTARGLVRFLEIATGASGFEVDEQVEESDGEVRSYHLHIRAPESTEPHRVLIERIIELEKPAYVTYKLDFGESERREP